MSFDRAFLVFAAGVTAAIHVGKLPPALPVLQAELGMTLVQGGFLLSMVQLAAVGLGLAVGLAADGLGLRRVMAGGLVLLAVASALGGLVRDPATLLLLRAAEGMGFLLAGIEQDASHSRVGKEFAVFAHLRLWVPEVVDDDSIASRVIAQRHCRGVLARQVQLFGQFMAPFGAGMN